MNNTVQLSCYYFIISETQRKLNNKLDNSIQQDDYNSKFSRTFLSNNNCGVPDKRNCENYRLCIIK